VAHEHVRYFNAKPYGLYQDLFEKPTRDLKRGEDERLPSVIWGLMGARHPEAWRAFEHCMTQLGDCESVDGGRGL
jgi:hypothetical protein